MKTSPPLKKKWQIKNFSLNKRCKTKQTNYRSNKFYKHFDNLTCKLSKNYKM